MLCVAVVLNCGICVWAVTFAFVFGSFFFRFCFAFKAIAKHSNTADWQKVLVADIWYHFKTSFLTGGSCLCLKSVFGEELLSQRTEQQPRRKSAGPVVTAANSAALHCSAIRARLQRDWLSGTRRKPQHSGQVAWSVCLCLSPVSPLIWFVLFWFKSMDWRKEWRLNMKTLQNKRNARWVLCEILHICLGPLSNKESNERVLEWKRKPWQTTQTSQFHFSIISHVSAPHLLLPCISVMKQTPQPSHKQLKSSTASPSLDTLVNSSPWGTKQLFCSPFQCLWRLANAG